jgi:hypothetical protein
MRKVVLAGGMLAMLVAAGSASAGIYTDAGVPVSGGGIVGWATGVSELVRGPRDIANPAGGLASFGAAADALGAADGLSLVSLGDGGRITLTFDAPITNGPGADFAVFENSFVFGGQVFAELGLVEVSSNGVDFVRFAAVSLTQTSEQLGAFGGIDATELYNLAGKHEAGFGTGFDLQELAGVGGLDVNAVTHVRVVDVVGRITPADGYVPTVDSLGNIINDPYVTNFASSGFDFDAVGVIHAAVVVPEPGAMGVAMAGGVLMLRRRRA